MTVKTGFDFCSYKCENLLLGRPKGLWQCGTECTVSWELPGQVSAPQNMGHQVIGDTVPAVGTFSIRM